MKTILLITVAVTTTTIVVAQQSSPTIDTAQSRPVTSFNNNILRDSKFSHETSKGKVYILPYDNMPCLVPNTYNVAPMPGSVQRYPNSRMPNAFPRKRSSQ